MPDDVTIKVTLTAQFLKVGRGAGWVGSVGRFEAQAARKPEVQAELAALVKRAAEQRDLGSILRVGVAGGEVHVLHVRHDGRYEIVRAPLPAPGAWSEPRHHGPDVEGRGNAAEVFADRLERAHAEAPVASIPDAETALRLLAESVGVVADGEWRDVAQQTARAFSLARGEVEGVHRFAAESRQLAEMAMQGETPEGKALARLLGLRGSFNGRADPAETRREALVILAESEGQRFAQTLTEERCGCEGWLELVDRLICSDYDAEIQSRIDHGDLIEVDELEEKAADAEWQVNGPIDQAFAGAIERDELPDTADKAMTKLIAAKVQEALAEERQRAEDTDLDCRNAVLEHLDIEPAALESMAKDDLLAALQGREVFADLLGDDYEEGATVKRLATLLRDKFERLQVGAAVASPADVTLDDIVEATPQIRVWPRVGKGAHAVYASSAGLLLSVETHDLETTLISVDDLVAWDRSRTPEAHEPSLGGQLHAKQVRAMVDEALIIPAKVTEKQWLHDIEGVQVYLGEDGHWHIEHRGGHEVDTGWKRGDAVARACAIVNDARAVLLAQNPTELLLALSAAVRGLLRGQATIADVLLARDRCRAAIPTGHPHASSIDGLLAIVADHVDGHPLLRALERLHEELDNRALLPALPISVRALLNTED